MKAIKKSLARRTGKNAIIWFEPGAKAFDNKEADKLAKFDDVVLVCGRYEGIDTRKDHCKAFGKLHLLLGEAVYTGGKYYNSGRRRAVCLECLARTSQ